MLRKEVSSLRKVPSLRKMRSLQGMSQEVHHGFWELESEHKTYHKQPKRAQDSHNDPDIVTPAQIQSNVPCDH